MAEESLDMEPLETLLRPFRHSHIEDSSRSRVIQFLEGCLGQWARILGSRGTRAGGAPTFSAWQTPKPVIVSFGSHRLGVSMEESDLDLLVVAPPSISGNDFFTSWVEFLRTKSNIKCLHPIPEAYTPVLRFEIDNISIDMLFASLADGSRLGKFTSARLLSPGNPVSKGPILRAEKRKEYQITDQDLIGQDEAGLRSLNGARVSQILLKILPDLDKYQVVLRAVKRWAMLKGVYSNVLGFLGGVNWAILVAKICREHPHKDTATPADLLAAFFRTFAYWNWERDPVMIAEIQQYPPEGVPAMRVWDPAKRFPAELMPIITPAYPAMNSSYNVAVSQKRRLRQELKNAWMAIKKSEFGVLFRSNDFCRQHETFLQVSIRARNRDDFAVWFRWVESRLRCLINELETPELRAWPQSRFYNRAYDEWGDCVGSGISKSPNAVHETLFFIGLEGTSPSADLIRLTRPFVTNFLYQVNTWNHRKPNSMKVALICGNAAAVPTCCYADDPNGDVCTANHRFDCDSHSGKITPQTSAASIDDDSLASDY